MMKYLKAKFIIPALILIITVIILLMYFVGALKVNGATIENKEFDITEFTDVNDIGTLNTNKLIGQNSKFKMYFNEDTTVVTIIQLNGPGDADDKIFTTAIPSTFDETTKTYYAEDIVTSIDGSNVLLGTDNKSITSAMKSNFSLYYLDSFGKKMTTTFNTLDNSVAFKSDLTDEIEKHYSIRYLPDENAVQVCYEIGKHSASADYFPSFVKADDFEELLRGNVMFNESPDARKNGRIEYLSGSCWGFEAANYIYENGLAENIKTQSGLEFDPEDEDIPHDTTTQWNFTTLSDELVHGLGTHLNCEGSPLIYNPFVSNTEWNFIRQSFTLERNSETYVDEDGNPIRYYYATAINASVIAELYEYLYTSHPATYYNPSVSHNNAKKDPANHKIMKIYPDASKGEDFEPFTPDMGGFQKRDEDGNFLYKLVDGGEAPFDMDNLGDYELDVFDNPVPVQELYSLEIVDSQNSYFGVEPVSLPMFRIAIEFKLTETGLTSTILRDSLKDTSNYVEGVDNKKYNSKCQLCEVIMFPFLTSSFLNDATDGDGNILGEIIVPDGSGASIHFNNGASDKGASAYRTLIYGEDKSHLESEQRPTDTQSIMFPMYGFLNRYESRGAMAICNKGANLTYIYADVSRSTKPYNQAYFDSKLREVENLVLVYGYHRYPLTKYAADLTPVDFEYSYNFLNNDELTYTDLAKKYQSYLMNYYGIEYHDETSDHPVIDVNFIGAYRHYVLTLGIIYYRKSPLTTFKEATQILTDLNEAGINNLTVSYKGWTQDGLEPKLRKNLKTANCLGSSKDLDEFISYMEEKDIDFYPELNMSFNKGYKYNFGGNKYSSRGVGNVVTKMYDYDLAKLEYNKKSKASYIVSPKFYMSASEKYSKSFAKVGSNGIYLLDLGNAKIGDYHKNRLLYSDESEVLIKEVLEYWGNDYKIQLKAPFDYALSYASSVVGVPFTTTYYPIIDDCIPFYELVLNGIVDYSSVIVNGTDDNSVNWFVAKCIESGANLSYQLSEEDNSVLLETDYTQYYRVNFEQWKDTIIDMYNKLDASGVASGRITLHRTINVGLLKIAYVEYSNGLKYYVNSNSSPVTYGSLTIPAYGYVKVE